LLGIGVACLLRVAEFTPVNPSVAALQVWPLEEPESEAKLVHNWSTVFRRDGRSISIRVSSVSSNPPNATNTKQSISLLAQKLRLLAALHTVIGPSEQQKSVNSV